MKKRNGRQIITVKGSGMFPIDMLRYDHAWPRTEEDSHKVAADYRSDENYPRMRTVELLSDHERAPTEDRWRSFTWEVVKVEYVV